MIARKDFFTRNSDKFSFKPKGGPAKFGDSVSFKQLCSNLVDKKWKRVWLDDQKVPFMFNGNTFIGYDDTESIQVKVHILRNKLSKQKQLHLKFLSIG
jgi:GH18 family chitinase